MSYVKELYSLLGLHGNGETICRKRAARAYNGIDDGTITPTEAIYGLIRDARRASTSTFHRHGNDTVITELTAESLLIMLSELAPVQGPSNQS